MWTVRQAPSQRDTPMLSGRTLHDRSRVRWLDQNRDPARDRAWRWAQLIIVPARVTARRHGAYLKTVTPRVQRELRDSAHYGYNVRC